MKFGDNRQETGNNTLSYAAKFISMTRTALAYGCDGQRERSSAIAHSNSVTGALKQARQYGNDGTCDLMAALRAMRKLHMVGQKTRRNLSRLRTTVHQILR